MRSSGRPMVQYVSFHSDGCGISQGGRRIFNHPHPEAPVAEGDGPRRGDGWELPEAVTDRQEPARQVISDNMLPPTPARSRAASARPHSRGRAGLSPRARRQGVVRLAG